MADGAVLTDGRRQEPAEQGRQGVRPRPGTGLGHEEAAVPSKLLLGLWQAGCAEEGHDVTSRGQMSIKAAQGAQPGVRMPCAPGITMAAGTTTSGQAGPPTPCASPSLVLDLHMWRPRTISSFRRGHHRRFWVWNTEACMSAMDQRSSLRAASTGSGWRVLALAFPVSGPGTTAP